MEGLSEKYVRPLLLGASLEDRSYLGLNDIAGAVIQHGLQYDQENSERVRGGCGCCQCSSVVLSVLTLLTS